MVLVMAIITLLGIWGMMLIVFRWYQAKATKAPLLLEEPNPFRLGVERLFQGALFLVFAYLLWSGLENPPGETPRDAVIGGGVLGFFALGAVHSVTETIHKLRDYWSRRHLLPATLHRWRERLGRQDRSHGRISHG